MTLNRYSETPNNLIITAEHNGANNITQISKFNPLKLRECRNVFSLVLFMSWLLLVSVHLWALDLWFYIGYAALMIVESPISPGYKPNEKELLETFLLMTLEEHDGLCLDNQPERIALASALTHALVSAAKDGAIDFVRLLEPLQTGENSGSAPVAE